MIDLGFGSRNSCLLLFGADLGTDYREVETRMPSLLVGKQPGDIDCLYGILDFLHHRVVSGITDLSDVKQAVFRIKIQSRPC